MASDEDSHSHSDSTSVAPSLPDILVEAVQFEQQQWVNEPAVSQPFYQIDNYSDQDLPGTLLKLEKTVNPSLYSLPPTTSLSRFLYQSQNLSGTSVPVSAYVLWPFTPRSSPDGYNVVAWAHGTTGICPNYAPSNMQDLAHHFIGPYQLALHGYVVVATDYAGLGVSQTTPGHPIPHQYLAHPAQANDVIYAVQAAKKGFPSLGKKFVVAGYSQGGGACWAVAQRQAVSPAEGYLGAVAVCPMTRFLDYQDPIRSTIIAAIAPTINSVFPGFTPSQILTKIGQQTLALALEAGGSLTTLLTLLGGMQPMLPTAITNQAVLEFHDLTANGHRAIAGPLLVIQGQGDPMVDYRVTRAVVEETVARFPDSQLDYVELPGVGHNPAMFGAQWVWMDWIAQRFAGEGKGGEGEAKEKGAPAGESGRRVLEPAMPVEARQVAQNWWVALATNFYQTP